MNKNITPLFIVLLLFACKTTQTVSKNTTNNTANPTAANARTTEPQTAPQQMHATPPTIVENAPSLTSPMLIGTWELDSLSSDGQTFSTANLPKKNTLQFTGTGLMIVKGNDQKEKFFTYSYKDSMITTLEESTPMYVKSLNSRNLEILMEAEGKKLRMVYKKK